MLALSLVLQIYLKAPEELSYFYQIETKFQGYLSKWISYWDKQWRRYETFLYH